MALLNNDQFNFIADFKANNIAANTENLKHFAYAIKQRLVLLEQDKDITAVLEGQTTIKKEISTIYEDIISNSKDNNTPQFFLEAFIKLGENLDILLDQLDNTVIKRNEKTFKEIVLMYMNIAEVMNDDLIKGKLKKIAKKILNISENREKS